MTWDLKRCCLQRILHLTLFFGRQWMVSWSEVRSEKQRCFWKVMMSKSSKTSQLPSMNCWLQCLFMLQDKWVMNLSWVGKPGVMTVMPLRIQGTSMSIPISWRFSRSCVETKRQSRMWRTRRPNGIIASLLNFFTGTHSWKSLSWFLWPKMLWSLLHVLKTSQLLIES